MGGLRLFARNRPAIAALLLAAALCLKVLVPMGYMPQSTGNGIVVTLCSGATTTIAIPGKDGEGQQRDHGATTADHPCAFAPLGAHMIAADVLPLVLAALLFVFVAAILGRPQTLRAAPARIRPPSHAPPALA